MDIVTSQIERVRLFFNPKQKACLIVQKGELEPIGSDWIWLASDTLENVENFIASDSVELIYQYDKSTIGAAENIYERYTDAGQFRNPFKETKRDSFSSSIFGCNWNFFKKDDAIAQQYNCIGIDPTDDGRPMIIYWEDEYGHCFLDDGCMLMNDRIVNEDYADFKIPNLAIWSYWPNPIFHETKTRLAAQKSPH